MSKPWPELLLLAHADKQNCSENNSYVHADKLEEAPALAKRNYSEIDSFTVDLQYGYATRHKMADE